MWDVERYVDNILRSPPCGGVRIENSVLPYMAAILHVAPLWRGAD